jgi:hypothetical protein
MLLCTLLLACQTPKKDDANAHLADAFCDCTLQLSAQDKRAAAIANGSDADQILLNGALEELQKTYDAAVLCLQPALSEYGYANSPEKIKAVTDFVKAKCPDQLRSPNLIQELLSR